MLAQIKIDLARADLSVAKSGPDAAHNVLRIHLAVLIRQLGQLCPLSPHINVLARLIVLYEHSLRELLVHRGSIMSWSPCSCAHADAQLS